MLRLTDKLAQIQGTGILTIDLAWLNNNYQRTMARYTRPRPPSAAQQRAVQKRQGSLACRRRENYRKRTL